MAEVTISGRHVTRIAMETGRELEAARDQQAQQFQARQLDPVVATRAALAVVEVDGGRLQIRGVGDGPGAHDAAWREDKVALLGTAARLTFDDDPEPDLPACFREQSYVEKLVREISSVSSLGTIAPPTPPPPDAPPLAATPVETDAPPLGADPAPTGASRPRVPEFLVRTYVASTCGSDAFGPMVAAEAQKRNFQAAARGAFVGDGAAWIWNLQRLYFPAFQGIVDFLHVLGYLFAAAKAVASDPAARWAQFQAWAEACWQGRVALVLDQMRGFQAQMGMVPATELKGLPDDDPRKVLAESVGYLENNEARMDYPSYRREGLPITSGHIESTVKRFNRRVKGTEKSWGGAGAEAILQLRAAFLSEDDRLEKHQQERPCRPHRNYQAGGRRKAA